MKKKIKQFITILTLSVFLLTQVVSVNAFEIPSAPTSPSVPVAPTEPPPPPTEPTAPPVPTTPTTPLLSDATPTPTPTKAPKERNDKGDSGNTGSSTPQVNSQQESSAQTPLSSTSPATGQQTQDGQTGDTLVQTGDVANTGVINSFGNNNLSLGDTSGLSTEPGVSIINTGNGSNSNNNGSATIINDNTNIQNNNAGVENLLNQKSITGINSASKNLGNSTIQTGDANTTGTIITGVNTNVDGVTVSEFNVADNHTGDLVLDLNNPTNCIAGCNNGSSTVTNSGNGTSSQNNANLTEVTNNSTFQNNDSTVGNEMNLLSNSGDNTASKNTNGDSTITTGDANIAANALTFVNNNLAGNVSLGVVNIFGNLIGDIILPDSAIQPCTTCGSNTTVANLNNNAGSDNTTMVTKTSNDTTFQTNDATIENNLILAATTGDNTISKNTGGTNFIQTGDSSIDAKTLNVVNSNLDGGNMWLVLINEAGQWVGKILGAPSDSNFAGSTGTEFTADQNGGITVTNSGNGADSQNTGSVSQTSNDTTVQNNTTNIVNNLNLGANTGGNDASKNTGGNSSIKTGDAKIIANLINFANNNIKGNGKLVVTIVNVFGKWLGDFVAPGQQKQKKETNLAIGGEANLPNTNTNDNKKDSNNNNSNNIGGQNNNQANSNSSNGSVSGTTVTPIHNNVTYSSGSFGGNAAVGFASALVAGISTKVDNSGSTNGENSTSVKPMKINLAWVILIIPALIALAVVRKRKSIVSLIRRNKSV